MEKIVDLVNSEVAWNVYEWGKRGLNNDVSLLGKDTKKTGDNKVISQDISNHIVHLHPLNKVYLELSTIHGSCPENLKFDFSTL